MNELTENAMAVLERLTDPTEAVLGEARELLDDLELAINSLESAVDDEGDDARNYLTGMAHDATEALTRLARLLEEKNR
jgi:hypothetical protein